MRVSWVAPTNNGGAPITGYTATAYADAGGTTVVGTCTGNATSTNCTIRNLARGVTLWFDVVARNVVGASVPSARVSGIPN